MDGQDESDSQPCRAQLCAALAASARSPQDDDDKRFPRAFMLAYTLLAGSRRDAGRVLQALEEDVMSNAQRGAEIILELLRTNGIDCIFASPIAVMAPLWEALAG